ncbi:hypothetical protein CARUB_v10027524mg [Capsella rubella]|uniref:Uncharacterized protein n=1 Tax=Capsella rubella TaxID=81985 RepID=R0GCF4_9BRAS|nr:transcription factor MYB34 [Capsella rubella]EOA14344.1 hypothetical protein CARUB_v10027524mg [Capsella rubella]
MVRTPCCKEEGIKKGAWTPEEDQKLIAYLQLHGEGGWRTLPEKAGLKRCGKSCRLRWANYLRPDIKRGEFSPEEDDTIIKLHALKGNKWAAIAASLAGRTDNEIKNYWNTNLKKRIKQKKGLDPIPITHKSINSSTGQNAIEPINNNKPVRSSGSARLLNRVASKYAAEFNRDLLTGLISGNRTVFGDSQNPSGKIDPRDSTLLNKVAETSVYINSSTLSDISDNCFNEFLSNEEISDNCFNEFLSNEKISDDFMYTTIDNIEFMEELKGILSGSGAEVVENSSDEVNAADEMEFIIGCWNE